MSKNFICAILGVSLCALLATGCCSNMINNHAEIKKVAEQFKNMGVNKLHYFEKRQPYSYLIEGV